MLDNVTIKARLIGVLSFLSLLLLVIGVQGLMTTRQSNEALATVYNDRLIPTGQLANINNYMQDNIRQLQLAGAHDGFDGSGEEERLWSVRHRARAS